VKPPAAEAKPVGPRAAEPVAAHEPAARPELAGDPAAADARALANDVARAQPDLPSRERAAAATTPSDAADLASAPDDDATTAESDDPAVPLPVVTAAMLSPAAVLPPPSAVKASNADANGCEQDAIDAALAGVAAGKPAERATADTVRADRSSPAVGAVEVPDVAVGAGAGAAVAAGARDRAALAPKEAVDHDLAAEAAATAATTPGQPSASEVTTDAALAALARSALTEPAPHTSAASDTAPSAAFAISLAGAQSARAGDVPAPVSVQAQVPTPLTDPGFRQALGYQVSLLARDGIGQAELHLNPIDMGPVSVQITMTGDQARVDFGADLAQTRQLLEAGWAELASSLKDAGFTLSGGGVSDHARERQAPQGQGAAQSFGGRPGRDSGEASAVAPVVARRVNGGVDVYA
jgi:flagellar hook-length control protein FliK